MKKHLIILICLYFSGISFLLCQKKNWTTAEVIYPQKSGVETTIINEAYKPLKNRDSLSFRMYKPELTANKKFPVVLFVLGFRDSVNKKEVNMDLHDIAAYTSWGKLLASEGFMAISYQTQYPSQDLTDLLKHLSQNAERLQIDVNAVGMWSCSANAAVAVWALSQHFNIEFKAASLYYGVMPTTNDSINTKILEIINKGDGGMEYPRIKQLYDFSSPVFLVRVGKDQELIKRSIDSFLEGAIKANKNLYFINYAEGIHAFDTMQDNETTKEIIRQTIDFFKFNLM